MNSSPSILRVAVPSPLWQSFDYLLPQKTQAVQPGVRLKVPFGQREAVGILLEVVVHSTVPADKLKPIIEIIDEKSLIPPSLLKLYRWASNYYHYPIGEIILGSLPRLFRQGKTISCEKIDTLHQVISPPSLELNVHQQSAVNQITASNHFQTFLLSGITGSGKTEVYLRCIEKLIQQQKQALFLVPEIGLTPQTLQRFRERFNIPIVVLHSNLTDKKRAQAWIMAKTGVAKIVIGTRSAIFTPLLKPGMVILDEEHDLSFKQQSGFRYSARDLAVMRGQFENIPVMLGSATPSLESLYNVRHRRYRLLPLRSRAGNAALPKLTVVDLRQKKLIAGLSEDLLISIEKHIKNNGQVLLFLNRRGYAPTLLCHGCGWVMHCDRCDARLTLHYYPKRLYCHHCGAAKKIPLICSQCQQQELIDVGFGTERLEAALQHHFPGYGIVRIDRDSTRTKNSMEDKLNLIHNQAVPILIGTQMVAKGHHFAHLTLVAIVDADSGLYNADFRATERMGQLLTQVSGRAGRVDRQGEVLIQTHQSNNPFLILLLKEGYEVFAQALLQERQLVKLPPFTHLTLLRAEAVKQNLPLKFLLHIKECMLNKLEKKVDLLGPVPAVMERKAGRYRYQLLFQSEHRKHLHHVLNKLILLLANQRTKVHWSLDIDPQETI